MPDTLNHLPKEERAFQLSQASGELLPDPGLAEKSPDEVAYYRKVIDALARHLNIEDPYSRSGRVEVLEHINDRVREWTLENTNRDAIRDRLGARGDLAAKYYREEIEDSLENELAKQGLTANSVLQALNRPDEVEHLDVANEWEGVTPSYFLRHVREDGNDPFSLLVGASREKSRIMAREAWRFFWKDYNLPRNASPFQCLKAFVERYGKTFNLGNKSGVKLLLDTEVRWPGFGQRRRPPTHREFASKMLGEPYGESAPTRSHFSFELRPPDKFYFRVAYAIDANKYREEIRRRHRVVFYEA